MRGTPSAYPLRIRCHFSTRSNRTPAYPLRVALNRHANLHHRLVARQHNRLKCVSLCRGSSNGYIQTSSNLLEYADLDIVIRSQAQNGLGGTRERVGTRRLLRMDLIRR